MIPDVDKKSGVFIVRVRNGKAHLFPISSDQLTLTFIPNSHDVAVSISDLRVEGSVYVKVQALFKYFSTSAEITADNINFSARCTLGQNNGKITLNIHSLNTNIGYFKVNLSGCLIDEIVQIVVNMDELFKDKIEANVPSAINDLLLDILNTIPYNVQINGGIMIAYYFPEAPVIVGDEFRTTTLGYLYPTKNPHMLLPIPLQICLLIHLATKEFKF